jgi:hypothetical protein
LVIGNWAKLFMVMKILDTGIPVQNGVNKMTILNR